MNGQIKRYASAQGGSGVLALKPEVGKLLAVNQLVNHLDKFSLMTQNKFNPNVIIRTAIGSKKPLDGGSQHTQNHTIYKEYIHKDKQRTER